MTKDKYCHLAILMDKSGSMANIRDEVIGSFNTFLEEQKKVEGVATITLAFFDSASYEKPMDNIDLKDAKPLTRDTYVPGALTPLLDSIGKLIVETGEFLKAKPEEERPFKVIFTIITDGLENASTEYNKDTIKKMIETQTNDYKWDFVFLGANMDAIAEGAGIGVQRMGTMTYAATPDGYKKMTKSYSQAVACSRATGDKFFFSEEDRKEQEDELNKATSQS